MKNFKLIIAINIILILVLLLPQRIIASELKENSTLVTSENNLIENSSLSELMLGDLNNDRIIDINDIVIMFRHITATTTKEHNDWLLKDEYLKIADLTGDGIVDDDDSLKLLRYVSAKNNQQIAEEHKDWLELKVGKNVEIEVSQIYLNKSEMVIIQGETEQLLPIVVPTNAKDLKLQWESSDLEVAEVNENGIVTAKNLGEAIIKVRTSNNKESECIIKVIEPGQIVVDAKLQELQQQQQTIEAVQQQQTLDAVQQQQTIEAAQQQQVLDAVQQQQTIEAAQQQQALDTVQQQQTIEAAQQQQALDAVQQQQTIEAAQQQQIIEATQQQQMNIEQQESVIEQQRRIIAEQQQALANPAPTVTPTPITTPTPTVEPNATPIPEIKAEGIAIVGAQTLDLSKMKSKKLTYTIRPSNTTNKTVTWTSSNPSVIEVNSSTGEVIAKKNGEAVITATTVNNKKGTCKIKVITTCSGVKIKAQKNNLLIGNNMKIEATVQPSTATNKALKWTSSNKSVATVDGYGKVTARGNGTAKITATTSDGSKKSGSVTIDVGTYPTRVTLNKSSESMELGDELKLTSIISPPVKNLSPGYDKITWSSSDDKVATVSSDGLVTTKDEGTAMITARTKNNVEASCKIIIEATKVEIDKSELTIGYENYTLKAKLSSTKKYNVKDIKWTSSDTSVVTFVNNNNDVQSVQGDSATIKGLKNGKSTITAVLPNNKLATCEVTVKQQKVDVLFVGNSKTYVHNIPSKFNGLAKSAGYKANSKSAVMGGQSILSVANQMKSTITSKAFDYVVLQEQTDVYSVDYDTYLSGSKKVKSLVRSKNPKTKLLVRQLWVGSDSSANTKKNAYNNAANVANNIGADLVYDGKAFDKSRSTNPNINLFDDSIHQSNEGAYLSACCIFCSVFHKSPVGLSYTAGLNKDTAKKLQQVAASMYKL